jgi:hypothetical protein
MKLQDNVRISSQLLQLGVFIEPFPRGLQSFATHGVDDLSRSGTMMIFLEKAVNIN